MSKHELETITNWSADEAKLIWRCNVDYWINGPAIVYGAGLFDDWPLLQWCLEHDCTVGGTYVLCPDKATFLMFGLRWA